MTTQETVLKRVRTRMGTLEYLGAIHRMPSLIRIGFLKQQSKGMQKRSTDLD